MAKRLYMTTADYVTIALSPALVMTLVGSLVYFLIEVMYAGDYQARLMYVFGLFVFAAVLVARISIEIGSEHAALFALPLGLATFFVLAKFVEHPEPVQPADQHRPDVRGWWCAHKLTWDCTLIDDDEDASGEGLMQRIGVDEGGGRRELAAPPTNELLRRQGRCGTLVAAAARSRSGASTRRACGSSYFSLAALPLFGIGQHWVPAAEVGRRRYVFALLLVYVASGLALLVTTSFLGLRRYLRQRRVEMPGPDGGHLGGHRRGADRHRDAARRPDPPAATPSTPSRRSPGRPRRRAACRLRASARAATAPQISTPRPSDPRRRPARQRRRRERRRQPDRIRPGQTCRQTSRRRRQ